MTVKEIFDLRRQGRVEEAYDAIRPLYAAHKGRYTTLCMYWTAMDILRKRIDEGRLDEADKIYKALERMLPRVETLEQELDRQQTAPQQPIMQATPPPPDQQQNESPQRLPLPWEQGAIDTNNESSPTSAAAAALQSAVRRLEKATQTPQGARVNGCGDVVRPASLTSASTGGEDVGAKAPQGAIVNSRGVDPTDTPPDISSEPRRGDRNSVSSVESVCQDDGIIRPIEGLNAMQRVILACVVGHPGYSVPRISESTGIPQKSIERHVSALIDRGLIEPRKGELNTVEYYQI